MVRESVQLNVVILTAENIVQQGHKLGKGGTLGGVLVPAVVHYVEDLALTVLWLL